MNSDPKHKILTSEKTKSDNSKEVNDDSLETVSQLKDTQKLSPKRQEYQTKSIDNEDSNDRKYNHLH